MKKGIILITLICSILTCSRVKALALDGTIDRSETIFDSETGKIFNIYRNGANNSVQTWYFDHLIYNAVWKDNYVAIPIRGFAQRIEQSPNNENQWMTDVELTNLIYEIRLYTYNNQYVVCELQSGLAVCPIKETTYLNIQIRTWMPDTDTSAHLSINEVQLILGTQATLYKTSTQQIIDSQNQNTQQILDSNTTYDQNATQDYTNQTQEMDNITNAEDTLMNNLDFNTTDMNITINPNASTFIWNIVDSLRLMSTKIVLLMTSIMSLGIIKLVLNR